MRKFFVVLIILFQAAAVQAADIQTVRLLIEEGDLGAAVDELKPLAQTGDAEAQFLLGTIIDDVIEGESGYQASVEMFHKAALQGHAEAAFHYAMSRGLTTDEETWYWIKVAADGGHPFSQQIYGAALMNGTITPRNQEQGFQYLLKAARNGDERAMNSVGHMYLMGRYVQKDMDKAILWFEKSANQNIRGEGAKYLVQVYTVRANNIEALKWSRIVWTVESNPLLLGEKVMSPTEISKGMRDEDIAKAEEMAQLLMKRYWAAWKKNKN